MERRAMCKNVGVCSRANKVQIITDDDQELKCPECGEEMELVPTTPPHLLQEIIGRRLPLQL